MKGKQLLVAFIGLFFLISLFSCGGGGGGGTAPAPAPNAIGGKVVKGYVKYATVIADKNANLKKDAGEIETKTDENGDFKMNIPADYGDYKLVSIGGVDSTTNIPAPLMVAPKGAKNITPITTLVALSDNQAEVKDKLEKQLGISYDADLYDNATENALKFAVAYSAIINYVSKVNPDVNEVDLAKIMAKTVEVTDNLTDNVTKVFDTVANNITDNLTFDNNSLVKVSILTIVKEVDNVTKNATSEEDIKDKLNTVVDTVDKVAAETVPGSVVAVAMTVGGVTDDNLTDGLVIENADPNDKLVKIKLKADNATGEYNVTIYVYVDEIGSKKEASVKIEGVKIKVDDQGNITKVSKEGTDNVTIVGTTAKGTEAEAFLPNLNVITIENNCMTFDLATVEKELKEKAQSDLKEVVVENNKYKFNFDIQGLLGFKKIVGTVEVGQAQQCDDQHLDFCLNQNDCENAGGFWYNDKCNAEAQQQLINFQIEKTGDITGTAGGVIGFKANVLLPEGFTCDNCTYKWDLDNNGKIDGEVGKNTVTAYFGNNEALQGTAVVYVLKDGKCVGKGEYQYDLAGDVLGATPPQGFDVVSLSPDATEAAPDCK